MRSLVEYRERVRGPYKPETKERLFGLIARIEGGLRSHVPMHWNALQLLNKRGITWKRDEPLHSRVGKYVKAANQERPLQDMTQQILKNSIGVFDKFNHVRNKQSLAHDNDLLHKAEARFIGLGPRHRRPCPDLCCIASKPSAAFCTSGGKSDISCTWRISMTSFSEAGQLLAHAIASSLDFTSIIQ
jgi:hypothetical protein